ncbi:hypothetical protein FCIRC_2976 [Fusarium circinatum]|uniref:Uncharacterized protein n=1 Tax=Fusarium circinatum TaxID=48490 RepID=A0A8H5U977_FUSCI|nr:hypothetical protein FCIRC_2976 [Fusarium circinatum]
MPREPPPWRGVRTIIEGKNAKLIRDNDEVLAETVLNRGTLLWDRENFCHGDPAEQAMHMHYSEESYDYGTPRRLLVGYSAYTLEPVLASINPEVLYIQDNMEGQNLSGLRLETISEGFLEGGEVILHHSLTVPGNLLALKLLLLEKDWGRAFHGGDLSVEGAKDLARQSAQSLYDGRTPVVLTRIKPATTKQVPRHKRPNTQRSVIPDEPYGPENRQLHEVLPRAKLWHNGPRDFVYKAPYMLNMRYPERLYHELAVFAKAHLGDKFSATAMLFAVQLWVDIEEHSDKMFEYCVAEPLPSVSLAVFIVYFEHWLEIHEHLRCLSFIHPFRLIHLLYWNDILVPCNRSRVSYVKEDAIDSGRVRWYVLDAKARDPEISVTERINLYPFMMSSSKMVYPQDIPNKFRLSETQQAMIRMPDLRVLGLPSYPTQESETIEIAMPDAIARITFLEETSGEHTFNDFFDATKAGPTSQFGNSLRSGTIWTHEFHKYTFETGRPIEEFITRDLTDVWTQLSDRRLRWLETLGVLGRVRLRTGEDGLPGYYGMPLEKDGYCLDDAYAGKMVQRALEDPRNRPEVGS